MTDEILISVVFTRPYGSYNSGETAGFPAEKVQKLVEEGVARLKFPPPESPKKKAAHAPEKEEEKEEKPAMTRHPQGHGALRSK